MKTITLVKKEFKELLSEKTIVIGVVLMPLILFPLMGSVFTLTGQTSAESISRAEIVVVNNDRGKYADLFIAALEKTGFKLRVVTETVHNIDEFIQKSGSETVIVIDKMFSQNIAEGKPGLAALYIHLTSMTFGVLDRIADINTRVLTAASLVGEVLASESAVSLSFYKNPVQISGGILYRGETLSAEDAGSLIQSFFATSFFVPLVLFIVVASSGTIGATSVGLEKEAKTLEMLLTMPVNRSSILASKLLGSTLIALMGTASMIFGLTFYLSSLPLNLSPVSSLSIQLSPISLLLLGMLLFVTLVATLGLGILAGVLAGDVRGGQTIASLMQLPLILPPIFLLLFADFSTLPQPVLVVMLLNPFTHMMLALQSLNIEAYASFFLHLAAIVGFMVLILLIASALFKGERLLTMRLQISRKTPPG